LFYINDRKSNKEESLLEADEENIEILEQMLEEIYSDIASDDGCAYHIQFITILL
jgi:hypothetical protein